MKKNIYGIFTEIKFLPSIAYAIGGHREILRKNPKQRLSKKQRRKIRTTAKSKKEGNNV